MTTRRSEIEDCEWPARSPAAAGECGDSLALWAAPLIAREKKRRLVGALQTLRDAGAWNLFRFAGASNTRSGLKSALPGALAALLLCAASAHAQSYSIDWFTIDGGGTSTSGVYSVSGTIGQPDAGRPMTGGNYSLTGGFWSLFAVQSPGAPLLSIERIGSAVRVFWPKPSSGFVLDHSLTVTGPWSQVSFPYTTNTTDISITVPSPVGNTFYRLRLP